MAENQSNHVEMEKIVSLSRRRGFVFQSSEIYGPPGGCWDYGPLGVLLKNNVKQAWWQSMVQERDDVVGVDASILMNPKVWEASGHVTGFSDPMQDCMVCKMRWRPGDFEGTVCPACGGKLTEPRQFNLMFKTFMGPLEDTASVVYLRPETAQGIFTNFDNVLNTQRKKLPFGIGQIGKSFRNEITTGNFIFRSREFEQMELEYFVKPGTDEDWHAHWLKTRLEWYVSLGMKKEHLQMRDHCKEELAHYAKACADIQYLFPMGWSELEGIANRQDFDLKQHSKFSGKNLEYFDEETKERFTPYVIEPSAGVDRSVLAFMLDAYTEEPDKDEIRTVLKLHPRLAPYKAAILPLSKKEPLTTLAKEIYASLRKAWMVTYDEAQSIGRRYRRQDEIGTPYCITVDFDSLNDKMVTVRDRDTMTQDRIPIDEIKAYLFPRLKREGM
ncbi:glycyl-tRNA synthetase [Dehalogenimonas formicexedens]|uniref:Glycine--tRNA ligase n=2 Tax=Dehalogenimonas formicexedens TaxID=1839801 RepID=A0A1P8F773_9CHLR|nr:glycyl-tRNA synthetase [Dehalogenimonas formicexedens]